MSPKKVIYNNQSFRCDKILTFSEERDEKIKENHAWFISMIRD